MRTKQWVLCPVCGRKYLSDKDGTPKKHYVSPKFIELGEVQYLTNPSWEGDQRSICPGSYEKGEPI